MFKLLCIGFLDGYYVWQESAPPEEDRYEKPRGQICAWLNSYITKTRDVDYLFSWMRDKDLSDRGFAKPPDLLHVYVGEFFWSAAYHYACAERAGNDDWVGPSRHGLPKPVRASGVAYLNEDAGFDCSIDDAIHLSLPSRHLIVGGGDKMYQ